MSYSEIVEAMQEAGIDAGVFDMPVWVYLLIMVISFATAAGLLTGSDYPPGFARKSLFALFYTVVTLTLYCAAETVVIVENSNAREEVFERELEESIMASYDVEDVAPILTNDDGNRSLRPLEYMENISDISETAEIGVRLDTGEQGIYYLTENDDALQLSPQNDHLPAPETFVK